MDPRARGGRGGDRDRGGDRRNDRGPPRDSSLGKRGYDERDSGRRREPHDSNSGPPGQLHFRMLVGAKKAGSVIGRGGDFIQLTRQMTGAKVAVDKAVELRPQDQTGPDRWAPDRLVHVEGADEPGKDLPGIQDAVLRTAERILGEENPDDGSIKLPHKCHLRMLLYKQQIGLIMGKKGATINEIRNKSSATIKLVSPPVEGAPIVPCALPDDEMITISGTPDQTLTALKMISDKLRGAAISSQPGGHLPHNDGSSGHHHHRNDYGRGSPGDKRFRADGPPSSGYGGAPAGAGPPPHNVAHMGPLPGALPPQQHQQPPPPANALSMALPFQARSVLDNNDSVKTEGLNGLATVEYRLLVPVRRSGVILGNKGAMINEIRGRTGARVNLFDEEAKCGERVLQIMSTEDVQDQHCAAFDAAMDCVQALLHDELATEHTGSTRIILPHGQVGAVMGKKGATIKELRNLSGASLQLSGQKDGVPACVKKGEEVLEIRGNRNAVLLTTHIVLVAVRGNMARGQLMFNYSLPANAPPPTPRSHPPAHVHLGPPGGAPPPHAGPPGGNGGRPRSRWDSAEPHAASNPPPLQQQQPLLGAPHPGAPLPGQVHMAGPPPPGVVYAQGPHPDAAGVGPPQPQPQVHYVQGPPPAQQQLPPGTQVHYIQGAPPPGQQGGVPGQPQQVVVYTSQPPPGSTYAPPQQVQLQQPQPQQVQQLQPPQQQQQQQPVYLQPGQQPPPQQQQLAQPVQHVVEYSSAGPYVQQQQPPAQVPQQQQPASSQQTVMYATVGGQPQQQYQLDPHQQQQQVVTSGPPGSTTVVQHGQPPQQVTYVYTQAPPPAAGPDAGAAAAASGAGSAGSSGPPSGYGGLAGLMAAIAPQVAAAAAAAGAPAPVAPVAPPAAPKARVLLTQEQVIKLRLNDPMQTAKLSALSGATLTLSDAILEHGAREVLLAGTDNECNTATNLMEALMRSA